jgi:CDP-glucose 4,6-dehydratase
MEMKSISKKFWKNKKILITGFEGFLGSWLTRTLVELGASVIGIDKVKNRPRSVLEGYRDKVIPIKGNICNLNLVRKTIDKYKPSIIFHLAAEAIVGQANNNPVRTFKSNIQGTWNILEASRGKGFICSIVVASSDKAYGSNDNLPYREDTTPLKGDHPYDVSKSCADLLCNAYYNTYKMPICVTRCGNIYGPGDYNFSRIIPESIRCALKGKTLFIRSNGKFIRDYVYVDDIVEGYIILAEKLQKLKLAGEAFNFSDENPISVLALVKKIYKLTRCDEKYEILNKAKYEIPRQYLFSGKARKVLHWYPKVNLEEGLNRTISWYKQIF